MDKPLALKTRNHRFDPRLLKPGIKPVIPDRLEKPGIEPVIPDWFEKPGIEPVIPKILNCCRVSIWPMLLVGHQTHTQLWYLLFCRINYDHPGIGLVFFAWYIPRNIKKLDFRYIYENGFCTFSVPLNYFSVFYCIILKKMKSVYESF